MKAYVLDANALIRYVQNGDGVGKVDALFKQAAKGDARLSMSVVNMGEVLYILAKYIGRDRALQYLASFRLAIEMVAADVDHATDAALLKSLYKLGYADSFAAALALRSKAILVSADPSFEKLGKTLKLLSLPRHRR